MYYYLLKEQAKLKNATVISLLLAKKTLKNKSFRENSTLKNTNFNANFLNTLK